MIGARLASFVLLPEGGYKVIVDSANVRPTQQDGSDESRDWRIDELSLTWWLKTRPKQQFMHHRVTSLARLYKQAP